MFYSYHIICGEALGFYDSAIRTNANLFRDFVGLANLSPNVFLTSFVLKHFYFIKMTNF